MQAAPMPPPPQPPVLIPQALEMLKSDLKRSFGIDIETDSTIQPDEQVEKEARIEMLTAVTAFMQQAMPAAQLAPELVPMIGEFLLFTTRTFNAGRQLEATIEEMVDEARNAKPQPKTDPEAEKAKAEMELEKARLQMDGERMKMEAQAKQAQQQADIQATQAKGQADMDLEKAKFAADVQMQRERMAADIQIAREKAAEEARLKREVATYDAETRRMNAAKVE